MSNHYLNQCWNIVNSILRNKLQGNIDQIHTFSFKKMHLKMSSGKWRPFCLELNGLGLNLQGLMVVFIAFVFYVIIKYISVHMYLHASVGVCRIWVRYCKASWMSGAPVLKSKVMFHCDGYIILISIWQNFKKVNRSFNGSLYPRITVYINRRPYGGSCPEQ